MPLKIDFGEVAERLRRFLRQTGRLPLRADESVIPVALVQDVSQDPFRGDPRSFQVQGLKVATAAANGVVGITAANNIVSAPGQPELLVIDAAIGDTTGAATSLVLALARQTVQTGLVGYLAGVNLPILNAPSAGTPQLAASRIFTATPAASLIAGGATLAVEDVLPNTPTDLISLQPIVLYPGDTLAVLNNTQNQQLQVNFIGRAFDPNYLRR